MLARSAIYALNSERANTMFEKAVILFPEKEVNSEVPPVKYKTGEMTCVARV